MFITSGLGRHVGNQPKAAVIAGAIGVVAEINPKKLFIHVIRKAGWTKFIPIYRLLVQRIKKAQQGKEAISLAYQGNVVDLWEYLVKTSMLKPSCI